MPNKLIITEKQFKLITEFNNYERNIIRIVEARGMFTNHDNIIAPIVKYVNSYIKTNMYDEIKSFGTNNGETLYLKKYEIIIPNYITKAITWAENIEIKVNIFNINEEDIKYLNIDEINEYHNGGFLPGDKLSENGKLNNLKIFIKGFSIYGEVISKNLYSTLYHEITHAFENYNRLKKNINGLDYYYKNTKYGDLINNEYEDYNMSKFNDINYFLFSNVENNANVASAYGDLERIKSKRENFSTDIKETFPYKEYNYYKYDIIPMLAKLDNSYWEKFKDIAFTTNKINQSTGRFKSDFIKSANYKLNDLLRGIGKVASQYYDDSEMKNNPNNKKALFK